MALHGHRWPRIHRHADHPRGIILVLRFKGEHGGSAHGEEGGTWAGAHGGVQMERGIWAGAHGEVHMGKGT